MANVEGTHIGAYKIERQLGRGGFGIVYVGLDTRLGRRAAIKQLLPELSGHRTIVERFFNEAKAAAAINHPGIVEIYDVGWHTDGSAYFAMKLLDGDSLSKRLKAGRLPVKLAATIGRQVASALGAAHAAGIVHRDLKPDNVMLVPDEEIAIGERAVILDFGIAKLTVENAISHTRSGMMMGTPKYMSPEQCKGAGEVDHRTDIYALGCILFEMLTGRVPFEGVGPGEIMGMHQFVDPPTVRSLRPAVPVELDALVTKLLAKKLDQRTQQMTELQTALKRFGTGGKAPIEKPSRVASDSEDTATEPFYVLPENTDTAYHLPKDPVSVAGKSPARTVREPSETPPIEPPSPTRSEAPSSDPPFKPRQYSPTVVRGEIDVPNPPSSRRTLYLVLAGAAFLGIVIAIVAGSRSAKRAVTPDAAVAVVADAARVEDSAPVPVVPDAEVVAVPVSPDIDKITTECKTANADKDWAKLSDCGKRLITAGGDGQTFVDRSLEEAKAEVAFRNLKTSLPRDFKEAKRLLETISASSVYYREAKQAFDEVAAQIVTTAVADLNALSRDCARQSTKLRAIEAQYGRAIAEQATAKARPCGNTVAEASVPNACADAAMVSEAEAKGDQRLQNGSFAAALQAYESILKCKPMLLQKVYLAACRARNFPKAKLYWSRFPAGKRDSMAQICMKEGFDPGQ